MKHLLKMSDLTPDEVAHILDVADELKAQQKAGGTEPLLKGKSVALMFSKNSTRTRTSFEVGVYQLGGLGNYMNAATELQSGRGEPLKDTARVLGRYYDCVVWRTYRQSDLEEFAEFAGVPVINGLTDYAHPCQVLADLMTIRERRGALAGQKLCFVGDGSNMANSLIVGGLLSGMKVDCVCPHGYRPAADLLMFAHKYGSAFRLLEDPAEGVKDADVVVTAVWNTAAPGTSESESRLRDFAGFQLTSGLLKAAKPDCMVLHCLPAHRGEEISTAVFEAHADEIFTEAENRLHVQKLCWRYCWRESKTCNEKRRRTHRPAAFLTEHQGVEPWHRSPGLSHFESLKLLDEAGSSRLSLAAEGIFVTSKKARHTVICRQKSAAFCEMTLEKSFFTRVVSGCISGVVVLDVR